MYTGPVNSRGCQAPVIETIALFLQSHRSNHVHAEAWLLVAMVSYQLVNAEVGYYMVHPGKSFLCDIILNNSLFKASLYVRTIITEGVLTIRAHTVSASEIHSRGMRREGGGIHLAMCTPPLKLADKKVLKVKYM